MKGTVAASSTPPYSYPCQPIRLTATWISSNGFGLETPQSLPNARTAPARTRLPNGYCHPARSGPRNGIVRLTIWPSFCAHSGCALATTPSSRNRGMSSGWITWMCAMWWRRSFMPFARRAASIASSASRTARSARAWKWTWNPSASRRVTASLQLLGVDERLPAVAGRVPVGVEVRLEDPGGEVLDHAVLHDLHAASARSGRRALARAAMQVVDLLEPAVPVPPQRADHPRGQLAVLRPTACTASKES